MNLKTKHGGPVPDGLWRVDVYYSLVLGDVRFMGGHFSAKEFHPIETALRAKNASSTNLTLLYCLMPINLCKWSD